ncbi:MAG: YdhR family protein [Anaerolineales bacterium]
MSPKLIQVNYKFTGTRAEFEAANLPFAPMLADLPGLRWKIWLMNEAGHEAGGIGLFDDEATLNAFVDNVLNAPEGDPTISEVTYKVFDVLEEHSAITRGPVGTGVPV